jgi:hypothetical protein
VLPSMLIILSKRMDKRTAETDAFHEPDSLV